MGLRIRPERPDAGWKRWQPAQACYSGLFAATTSAWLESACLAAPSFGVRGFLSDRVFAGTFVTWTALFALFLVLFAAFAETLRPWTDLAAFLSGPGFFALLCFAQRRRCAATILLLASGERTRRFAG